MIGVVLVSHENIAKEMLSVIQHIVGTQENLIAISIFPEDDMEKKDYKFLTQLKVDAGKGCNCFNRYVWWNSIKSSNFGYG